MITKMTPSKVKRRLILDCLRSAVNDHAVQREGGLLPMVLDVIADLLEFMADLQDDELIIMMVLDFVNAFFLVPLKKEEYTYFVAAFRGSFYIWLRVAQGSKNGPQTFGRVSALATRMTQSLAPTSAMRQQTYTDDPWVALKGTRTYVDRATATIILTWLALGFPLAFDKGQRGHQICWVGHDVHLDVKRKVVTASIKAEFLAELLKTTQGMMARNVLSAKEVRAYAGSANHVATLLWRGGRSWRDFGRT